MIGSFKLEIVIVVGGWNSLLDAHPGVSLSILFLSKTESQIQRIMSCHGRK